MKISLIVPNTRYESEHMWSALPSRGLLSLGAVLLQHGHDVEYIDADIDNLSHYEIIRKITAFGAGAVGITMNTFQAWAAAELAVAVKRDLPGLVCIGGGPHPSSLGKDTFAYSPAFDVLCLGEAEETIVDLARVLESKGSFSDVAGICYKEGETLLQTADRRAVQDLDSIPFPAYELAGSLYRYPGNQPVFQFPTMHIMASRGCPFQCIFCTKSVWGNAVRMRTPGNILAEIELLYEKLGIREIHFQDDTMNLNRKWFYEICDEIIRRGYHKKISFKTSFRVNQKLVDEELLSKAREAGFRTIFYGVESGSQKVLDTIRKGTTVQEIKRAFALTHAAGIQTIAAFMIGNVGDTRDTIRDTAELAKAIAPDHAGFSVATPLPGTAFYAIAKENNWIADYDFRRWSQFKAISRNEALSIEEIGTLRDEVDAEVRDALAGRTKRGTQGITSAVPWSLKAGAKRIVKRIPILNGIARRIYHAVRNSRYPGAPHWESYQDLSAEEIRSRMNTRYQAGEAYEVKYLYNVVLDNEIVRHISRMILPLPRGKVLEVGCGTGRNIALFDGWEEYRGTDLSDAVISSLRGRYHGSRTHHFDSMSADSLSYPENSFDLVLAREVLEHLPSPAAAVREAYRVLRPGGAFIISSPNRDSMHLRVNRMIGHADFVCCFDHIRELAYREAIQMLYGAGFSVEESKGVMLAPYWGIPTVDTPVRHLTDNDPSMIEMLRYLGEKAGPAFAFEYVLKAVKPGQP